MTACGLDFGTSNTTLGTLVEGAPRLAALEGRFDTVPSAIFFEPSGASRIGRAAIGAYAEGVNGRLMRAIKSVLGSPLLEEATPVGRERVRFREVIARYIGAVKGRAEEATGRELTAVVHGRPVHFVDGDAAADARAEAALAEIARSIGFRDVTFQFEPIAAALDYERQVTREEVALIADIGGGTSDVSIVRLGPGRHRLADRAGDILANDGIRVGGTDFDRGLSLGTVMPLLGYRSPARRHGLDVPSSYFHDLATWSSINRLYDRRVARELQEVERDAARPELIARLRRVVAAEGGHGLAMDVEAAKIALSEVHRVAIPLGTAEPGLAASVERADLVGQTGRLAERIGACIASCLSGAGLPAERIDAVFMTGGSTRLPHVRDAILAPLPGARVVDGDTFGSVGTGLTIEAARRYGG